MDFKISGSGQIGAGDYDDVKISGSGKACGFIRCHDFQVSGSAKSDDGVSCTGEFRVSGSCKVEKNIEAVSVKISGAAKCGGMIVAQEDLKVSGSCHCASVKCGQLKLSGGAEITGDIEAEKVEISGRVTCGGLLNAEEIRIAAAGSEIGSIGGTRITVSSERRDGILRLPLLSALIGKAEAVTVRQSIEGDTIGLENVRTPRVSGRVVAIGEDCEIDLVQYSEEIEISPKAKVGRTEKIS